ncbi:hypothetical protein LB531_21395 [Mesorhizobium sp. CO1-1-2]|uniref:hypothetical protein n=1 Tax=Mesorhizobium sp. CO1-1-2 TaxID=2876635 RepID=UPI001CCF3813|nr:hypothetical protein [Mesorhizobium sp. CO1-1-2]MBZ9683216.1 hypothetical protein [Mesorhizobium sp. CO1-1-2]
MSATVTVACKLPHGLILRLHTMEDMNEPTAGGGFRKVKRAQVVGEPIVLKGYNRRYNRGTDQAPAAIASSYALTRGVDAEFFKKWLAQNQDLDAVKNNLIWAHAETDMVEGFIAEHEKQKSGFEPIDPNNLPKGIQAYKKDDAAA